MSVGAKSNMILNNKDGHVNYCGVTDTQSTNVNLTVHSFVQ